MLHTTGKLTYGKGRTFAQAIEELLKTLPQQAHGVIVITYRKLPASPRVPSVIEVAGGRQFEVVVHPVNKRDHKNMVCLGYAIGNLESALVDQTQ